MTGNITLSPNGNTLAGATRAGNTVLLWDLTDARHPTQHPTRLAGHTALIEHVRFSPNGQLLASTSDDGTIRLWDTRPARADGARHTQAGHGVRLRHGVQPERPHTRCGDAGRIPSIVGHPRPAPATTARQADHGGPDDARSLAISPDNRTLAVGVTNGTVLLWDIENPRALRRLGPAVTGPDGIIHALTFSPDGAVLAGGASAGQTWLWRVTEQRTLDPIAVLQGKITRDGHTLASAAGDIHLWETDPTRAIRRVCQHAGDHITAAEWAKNIPDEPYRHTCP
jgi:WD40 repeat protein